MAPIATLRNKAILSDPSKETYKDIRAKSHFAFWLSFVLVGQFLVVARRLQAISSTCTVSRAYS
eukprot:6359136-Amphidinium_carterae.1